MENPQALPPDLTAVLDAAWQRARRVEGYLSELEFRALGLLAFAAPRDGVIVEIGSFKGKSTIALATIAARYGLGPVVSIDPHTSPSVTDPDLGAQGSSFDDFMRNLDGAGLAAQVEAHRAFSRDAAKGWQRPIRMLWIDGDHTYAGAKEDFDLYFPHVVEGGIVALHDTLRREFDGPIRVFVEEVLRRDAFGPAGFAHSVGWSQYRPHDGARFRAEREWLARRAAPLIPFVAGGGELRGLRKLRYKVRRWRVPHWDLPPLARLAYPAEKRAI